ncbi:unnamed protein product [Polarella glacialis]|uniref:Uncharacterized protein n=1 Tax=Polarella glacialis TaxID=89957 RepID=A0A813HSI6_POLGL|nr:unnamed protein product [Polarella glacialis]
MFHTANLLLVLLLVLAGVLYICFFILCRKATARRAISELLVQAAAFPLQAAAHLASSGAPCAEAASCSAEGHACKAWISGCSGKSNIINNSDRIRRFQDGSEEQQLQKQQQQQQ